MLKGILARLKNAGTVLSISSLVVGTLVSTGVILSGSGDKITLVVKTVCGVGVLLGIMNNPETPGIDVATKTEDNNASS